MSVGCESGGCEGMSVRVVDVSIESLGELVKVFV